MRFLLVEDDDVDATAFQRAIDGMGIDSKTVCTIESADKALSEEKFDLIIVDLGLPDRQGLEVVDHFVLQELPVLVFTGLNSQEVLNEALDRGARGFVPKTVNDEAIRSRVGEIIYNLHKSRCACEEEKSTSELIDDVIQSSARGQMLVKQLKAARKVNQ